MELLFNIKEINKIAKKILKDIYKLENQKAVIVTLSGDLGTGKTTLTKEIAKILNTKEKVISPTFVIFKKYKLKNKKFKNLIHIDAYRLKKSKELINLGWKELVKDKSNLIILEWPENVSECIKDENIYEVILAHKDKKNRIIKTLL